MDKLKSLLSFMFVSVFMFSSNASALTFPTTSSTLAVDTSVTNVDYATMGHNGANWFVGYQTETPGSNCAGGANSQKTPVYIAKFTTDLTVRLIGFNVANNPNLDVVGCGDYTNGQIENKFTLFVNSSLEQVNYFQQHTGGANPCDEVSSPYNASLVSLPGGDAKLGFSAGQCNAIQLGMSANPNITQNVNFNSNEFKTHKVYNPSGATVTTFFKPADTGNILNPNLIYNPAFDEFLLFYRATITGSSAIWVNFYDNTGGFLGRQSLFLDAGNSSFILNGTTFYGTAFINSTSINIAEFQQTTSTLLTTTDSRLYTPPGSSNSFPLRSFQLAYRSSDNTIWALYALEGGSIHYMMSSGSGGGGGSTTPTISYVKLDSTSLSNNTVNNVALGTTRNFKVLVNNPSSTDTVNVTIGLSLGFGGEDGFLDTLLCNAQCYVPFVSNSDFFNTGLVLLPGESEIVSRDFHFRTDRFAVGDLSDVLVAVRNATQIGQIFQKQDFVNVINITESSEPEPGAGARIMRVALDDVPMFSNQTFISFPSDYWVQQDKEHEISITFQNNGSTSVDYLVGLTIGEQAFLNPVYITGAWCNSQCYVADYFTRFSGERWVEKVDNMNPGDIHTGKVVFKFNSTIFEIGKTYDVLAGVWLEQGQAHPFPDGFRLTTVLMDNKIKVVDFPPPPQGTNLTITRIDVSDNQPALGETIEVTTHVKNTGSIAIDRVFVGLSLIQSGVVCNKDCYADGKGDYGILTTIYPGDEMLMKRTFTIRDDKFSFGTNSTPATFIASANTEQFVGAVDSIANGTAPITILNPSLKLLACPTSIVISQSQAFLGDTLSFKTFVTNYKNQKDFYLGLSIGKFNATDQVQYTQTNPCSGTSVTCAPTVIPCNTDCYRDGLPALIKKNIGTNFSDVFTRQVEIPEYFMTGQSFDVAVGVWGKQQTIGNNTFASDPICFVYFKNAVAVIDGQPLAKSVGSAVSGLLVGVSKVAKEATGNGDEMTGRTITWILLFVAIPCGIILYFGRDNPNIVYAIMITVIVSILVGWVSGWVITGLMILIVISAIGLLIAIVRGFV